MDLTKTDQFQNDGYLLHYKAGLFRDKWCQVYYKLHSDSNFEWFNNKKSKKAEGSVNLKNSAPNICIGPQTRLLPFKKPKLEKGWNQNQLIGIAKDKKVYYFYFKTIDNLKQWLSKVINKFPSNDKGMFILLDWPFFTEWFAETFTSSPYFSKNGKEIRVDHNVTTVYNSLDQYLGLYGFGWHFWLYSNENAPVYGDLMNCHESNHSVQHDETNNHHSYNIADKYNSGCNNDNNQRTSYIPNNNNDNNAAAAHTHNHNSTHNHGDFGCYNHSTYDYGTTHTYNTTDYSSGFSSGGGFSSSDCGGGCSSAGGF
uniref:PH domain-containing protein n=1 Tax=Panagrolaimus sp. ES5 TaxID=591445 RepID=A0AC34FAG3_9BILA